LDVRDHDGGNSVDEKLASPRLGVLSGLAINGAESTFEPCAAGEARKLNMVGPKSWFQLLALSCVIISGPAHADKRVALIVGNSDYVNVPRLANPANDARLVADTLRGLGFSVVGGAAQLNLDESRFRQLVRDFGAQLQGADVGLFYYAGHGVQVRGANYLVPVGANPTKEADVDFQMLDAGLVLRQMESAGTKLNLVILDACRNNPFGGRGLRGTDPGLAQMRAPEGTLISFATQPGNVAADGTDGHSPYTKALTQMMRQPGLDIFRTFNEVGLAVSRATGGAQQPWVSLSPITGDFFFQPAPASATPAAAIGPSEAERAWSNVKDSASPVVLEAFIRRYGDSFYADLARARLNEVKTEAVEARVPGLPGSRIEAPPIDAKPSPGVTATGRPILDFGGDQVSEPAAPPQPDDEFTTMGRRKLRFE
jgi:hypothetical protein